MDFEKILEEMKGAGRAQVFFVIFAYWTQFVLCFNVYLQMFSQGDRNYRCFVPGCDNSTSASEYSKDWLNFTIPYTFEERTEKNILDRCQTFAYNSTQLNRKTCDFDAFDRKHSVKCDTFIYESTASTLTNEWDLTCDRRSRLVLSMSIFMAGFLVGVYLFGIISDRYGRKIAIMITTTIQIISNTVIIFSVNFYMYLVLRFFVAASGISLMSSAYILLSEFITTHQRYFLGISNAGWQTSEMCLIALAYYIRDWKYLQIVAACLTLPFLLFFWIGIESPKWLISQKRYEDAKTAIKKFAKMQGKEVPESSLQIPEEEKDNNENVQKKLTPFDLFRTPKVRFRMILISIIWIFDSLISYSISLGAEEMSGSIYVNFALLATGDVIGAISLTFAIKYSRRVLCMSACMFSVAILSFCQLAVAPDAAMTIAGLAMCGRFMITVLFNMTYAFTAELFPTPLRSSALGTGSMFSRFGGIAAPYVATLIEVWRPLPVIILGSCGIIGGVVLLFLPETFNKPLPGTIEEIEKSSKIESLPIKLVQKLFSSSSRKEPPIVLKSVLKTS